MSLSSADHVKVEESRPATLQMAEHRHSTPATAPRHLELGSPSIHPNTIAATKHLQLHISTTRSIPQTWISSQKEIRCTEVSSEQSCPK